MLLEAEGEDGVFEGSGAVETPVVLGHGMGERSFEGTDASKRSADGVAVFLEGGLVLRSMDNDLAG
jgi:hypothetical protein